MASHSHLLHMDLFGPAPLPLHSPPNSGLGQATRSGNWWDYKTLDWTLVILPRNCQYYPSYNILRKILNVNYYCTQQITIVLSIMLFLPFFQSYP